MGSFRPSQENILPDQLVLLIFLLITPASNFTNKHTWAAKVVKPISDEAAISMSANIGQPEGMLEAKLISLNVTPGTNINHRMEGRTSETSDS